MSECKNVLMFDTRSRQAVAQRVAGVSLKRMKKVDDQVHPLAWTVPSRT